MFSVESLGLLVLVASILHVNRGVYLSRTPLSSSVSFSLENAKMVWCIVKNCKNTNTTCTPEKVSFHKIPENQIMREGWYKNIGEVVLPSNTVNARICSMHFTPESFVQPKRKRAAAEKISKRRSLLPSAVPTLYLLPLNEQASREEDNMNVIRREFHLVCPSTSTNIPIRSSTPVPSPAEVTEHLQDLDLLMMDSTSCHETLTSVSTRNQPTVTTMFRKYPL
ncbi:uncharacterized protein LOC112468933 isoform X2 [Temnothorax curvispinosus]|uniref:Uncharacterized protein LOC112468933 isoform X2 n=1 Tax=Temnothorax curvispinosus TaxID=300111 RepID=A0A6J1RGK4_9HYME|nr:uncharacterized protein LOC112468933 isoform X2 [Temnothorax curvispinosus]